MEQQFYLLLPLVVLGALVRGGRGRLLAVLLAGTACSAALNWWWAAGSVDRAFYGTDSRAAELLLGALLAVVVQRLSSVTLPRPAATTAAVGGAGMGLAALAVLFSVAEVQARWLYPWGLLATALATVAVILGVLQPGPLGALMSVGFLAGLGRISYGVYLLHWPVFLLLDEGRTGMSGPVLFVLRLTVTLLAAGVMYRVLERPIRYGGRLSPRAALRAVPAAAVVLLVLTLVVTSGLPAGPAYMEDRLGAEVVLRRSSEGATSTVTVPATKVPDPGAAADLPTADRPGASSGPAEGVPSTVEQTGPPAPIPASRVLLVGDSVAASLEDALGDTLLALGVDFATAATPGCGILTGFPTDEQGRVADMTRPCDAAISRHQLEAVAEVGPDLVMAMSSWEMTDRLVGDTWYPFGSPEADAILLQLLSEAVDRLAAGGARVVFVLLPDVVEGRVQEVGPNEVARGRHLNTLLTSAAGSDPARVSTVSLQSVVCPSDPCPPVVEGRELRGKDGRHFDDPAAAGWVANRLVEQVLAIDLGVG